MNTFSSIAVLINSSSLLNLCVTLLTTVAITLIFKTQTTTNFAQTTISTFGAYLVANLCYFAGMNLWVALIIGLIICFLLGLFIDTAVIRKGRAVNVVGKQIITMGFTYIILSIILLILPMKVNGVELQVKPASVFIDTTKIFTIGSISMPYNTLVCVGLTIVVLAVMFFAIYKTKFGLGVRMTASNETVAQMVGVNTHVITAASWSIACGLGCLAAVFTNNTDGVLTTTMMASIQISAFLGCIVGGFNTFYGPLCASAILWFISSLVGLAGVSISGITPWKDVIVYAIAMLLVLWKPSGLFGKALKKKV